MALHRSRGFTFVEIMIVVVIVALLSAVIFASFSSARAKGRDAKRMSDILQFQLALTQYYDVNKTFPDNVTTWASFDSTTYSPNLLTPGNVTLSTIMQPYVRNLADPKRTSTDSGYLYISNGVQYCILFYRTPEDMRHFDEKYWNCNRSAAGHGEVDPDTGQCVANASNPSGYNSIYIGTGTYQDNGC